MPDADAHTLALQHPQLVLRTEAAHQEAFVALPSGTGERDVHGELASEALRVWAAEQGITPFSLALRPEDLGLRITYLASTPVTATSFPDRDFAVPFALKSEARLTNLAH